MSGYQCIDKQVFTSVYYAHQWSSLLVFRELKLNTYQLKLNFYSDWLILYTLLIYICLHLNYEINISEMQLFTYVVQLKTLLPNCQPYG